MYTRAWILAVMLLLAIGGTAIFIMARGIRNNNPGNIRLSGDTWQGLSSNQTDSDFFQFRSPEWGIRAMAVILLNYQRKYALHTVRMIIGRWAPSSENDTASYVNSVAGRMGVDQDEVINVAVRLPDLIPAMIRHENGIQPYSQATIEAGIFRAIEGA